MANVAKRSTAIEPVGTSDDLSFTKEAGKVVLDFLKRAAVFFKRGDELEKAAYMTLQKAKVWKAPTDKAEHEALQVFIRDNNAAAKSIEEHWDQITKPLHGLHKRFVARRSRASDLRAEATAIGNSLHNAYVQAEQRKARELQEKLQREADARAQAERQAEVQKLEDLALAAEASSDALSDRERAFVADYLLHANASRAARVAGYKAPDTQALRLLQTTKIARAIVAAKAAVELRQQAEATKAQPIDAPVIEVKADIAKGGDRTTWKAEILDRQAFIEAAITGKHGIPTDVLTIDEVKLNQYARDLRTQINTWPGVRAKSDTKVV